MKWIISAGAEMGIQNENQPQPSVTTLGFKSPRLKVSVTYPLVLIMQAISKLLDRFQERVPCTETRKRVCINVRPPTVLRYNQTHVDLSALDFYLGGHLKT